MVLISDQSSQSIIKAGPGILCNKKLQNSPQPRGGILEKSPPGYKQ
jgi:hypothetical protein